VRKFYGRQVNSPLNAKEIMQYDYPKLIRERSKDLQSIEGQVLEKVLVHVVEPEYNALYL